MPEFRWLCMTAIQRCSWRRCSPIPCLTSSVASGCGSNHLWISCWQCKRLPTEMLQALEKQETRSSWEEERVSQRRSGVKSRGPCGEACYRAPDMPAANPFSLPPGCGCGSRSAATRMPPATTKQSSAPIRAMFQCLPWRLCAASRSMSVRSRMIARRDLNG